MDLISLLITVVVLGLIFYLAHWALSRIPLPEPFGVVANVILVLIVVIVLLGLLFGSISVPVLRLR
jgi:hypothetical protein